MILEKPFCRSEKFLKKKRLTRTGYCHYHVKSVTLPTRTIMKAAKILLAGLLLSPFAVLANKANLPLPHEKVSMNEGWRFIKAESPEVATNQLSYSAIRDWLL